MHLGYTRPAALLPQLANSLSKNKQLQSQDDSYPGYLLSINTSQVNSP